MTAVPNRVAEWVGITEDLLRGPAGAFPFREISAYIVTSFEVEAVAFNWWTAPDDAGVVIATVEDRGAGSRSLPRAEVLQAAHQAVLHTGLLAHHPLVRWFAATGEPAAQSMGRVPACFADSSRIGELYDRLDQYGMRQQLSLPVLMRAGAHEAFVMTRLEKDDFPADDVTVARRIQGLLGALRAQADAVRALSAAQRVPPRGLLTGRECAVLALLVDGFTATAIGRRLSMSPRTANKHVENIYRKLEVRDRVTATRVAESLGFVAPLRRPDSRDRLGIESRQPIRR